jgi:RNA polymerase sigma factor FliA
VEAATRAVSTKLGRTPTEVEIAAEMGMRIEQWRRMVSELRRAGLISATPRSEDERDPIQELAETPELQPDRVCAHKQLQSTLARAIERLPERYQRVVCLYYTRELTMKEIGEILGVNESRVSQIRKVALRKMATTLEAEGIHSVRAF